MASSRELQAVFDRMQDTFDALPHDDGLFWKPSRMRVVHGRHRTCDVLVLTRYGLSPADVAAMEPSLGEATMFNWSFYCALALDSKKKFVRGARSDKLRMRNGDPLPWGKWFVDALRAIRPKVVVVLDYFQNGGNDFEAHWPQFNVPLRYKDALHVMHPNKNQKEIDAFKRGWADIVAPALERKCLVGAKRIASGPQGGAIDAFSVLFKRARTAGASASASASANDPNAPRQLTGGNPGFEPDENARHSLSASPILPADPAPVAQVAAAPTSSAAVTVPVPVSSGKSEDITQDAESFWAQ